MVKVLFVAEDRNSKRVLNLYTTLDAGSGFSVMPAAPVESTYAIAENYDVVVVLPDAYDWLAKAQKKQLMTTPVVKFSGRDPGVLAARIRQKLS